MIKTKVPRVYIFGASGAGTTTLGEGVAAELGVVQVDCDDHYWASVEPPFSKKRSPQDRLTSMRAALGKNGWVLTGSCTGWGDELVDQAKLVVFVTLRTPLRLHRLRAREKARFGDRIEDGGDMFQIHQNFMRWAQGYDDPNFQGRNIAMHEQWLARHTKRICRINSECTPEHAVGAVVQELSET